MRHLLIALTGAAVLLLSGCATTTRTETRRVYAEAPAVNAGDDVRVRTKDGRKLDFRVTAVDDKKIEGKDISVAREDITSVKTLQTRTVTTTESNPQPVVEAVATTVSTLAIVWGVIAVVALILIL